MWIRADFKAIMIFARFIFTKQDPWVTNGNENESVIYHKEEISRTKY